MKQQSLWHTLKMFMLRPTNVDPATQIFDEDRFNRQIKIVLKFVAIVIALGAFASYLLGGCDPRYGCVESNFRLAQESRLPSWFTIPPGYARKDLSMTIIFYMYHCKIIVYGSDHKVLAKTIGTSRFHPITAELQEQGRRGEYPSYIIIDVDGIEEVYEHKEPNDILAITDDPRLTDVLKKSGRQ